MYAEKNYTIHPRSGYQLVRNPGGPVLGMAKLNNKEKDGLAFKNLSGQETLLPYEDWRLSYESRVKDLAAREHSLATGDFREQDCEDIADDMQVYQDECGNQYTFGFGLGY